MNPTIDDMKLAVALMLPEEIHVEILTADPAFRWRDKRDQTPMSYVGHREWLHACHLAELKLPAEPYRTMLKELSNWDVSATAEQRLEALCRVKRPEMFTA